MSIEYHQFSEFLTAVQTLVAPEGLGEELENFFRDQVGNALSDIQTIIPWYRSFNIDSYTKNDVEEFCAASIFPGPVGKVTQVFAYKPSLECRKYHYKRVSTAAVECWLEQQRCVQCALDPAPSNIYDTPYCNYVVLGQYSCSPPYLTGDEDDCRFKSLADDERVFAIGPDYRMYCAPRFPCGYQLYVQWQGVRRKWSDTSLVPVDQQLRETVMNYVEAKIAKKEREWQTKEQYEADYATGLRVLRYRYHDEQSTTPERDCTAAIEQLMPAFSPLYATSLLSDDTFLNEANPLGGDGDPFVDEN